MDVLILILLLGSCLYSGSILRKLDTAAKLRNKTRGTQRFRFMIGDFFSLILLVQIPLKFLNFELEQGAMVFLIIVCLIAVVLVWLTTIKTVSQAGIDTFGWRALVSMVLIPTMYIGCFYFAIGLPILIASVLQGPQPRSSEAFVWLVISLLGIITSPWIVSGALKSVSQNPAVEKATKVTDPFAD